MIKLQSKWDDKGDVNGGWQKRNLQMARCGGHIMAKHVECQETFT